MSVSYDGPPITAYSHRGVFVMWGPMIVKVCATKLGARFFAWRRNRA